MENEQELVTMEEFLAKQEAEEEGADLVLGGDDADECTYKQGYLPRQAVFSCLTCVPQGNAGICIACSLACHDGHEIIELWTKRRFRCDCGNSKFGAAACKLQQEKDAENKENSYNQNFLGLYCTCHRPYPNPGDEELGEMLQCCICEDWFHELHLGLAPSEKVPRDEEDAFLFDELICQSCIASKCTFLFRYPELLIPPMTEAAEEEATKMSAEATANGTASGSVEAERLKAASNEDVAGCSQTLSCKLKDRELSKAKISVGKAMFMDRNWRNEICQCDSCTDALKSLGLSFLLDETDSLQSYELLAKERRQSKLEQAEGAGMKLLNNLNHVHKMEFLHGIKDMASELTSFLNEFHDSGKSVASADVYEFFERLKQKRQRLS